MSLLLGAAQVVGGGVWLWPGLFCATKTPSDSPRSGVAGAHRSGRTGELNVRFDANGELRTPRNRVRFANELKLNHYNNLRADCEEARWKCHHFTMEVGALLRSLVGVRCYIVHSLICV